MGLSREKYTIRSGTAWKQQKKATTSSGHQGGIPAFGLDRFFQVLESLKADDDLEILLRNDLRNIVDVGRL